MPQRHDAMAHADVVRGFYYSNDERLRIRLETWQRYGISKSSLAAWAMSLLPMLYKPGVQWLDVGCGDGGFAAHVRAENSRVAITGIDLAPAMVDATRSRLGSAADIRVAEAAAMPFPAVAFDVVTAIHVFHHLPDPSKVFAEVRRVTASGGYFLMTVAETHADEGLNGAHYRAVAACGLPAFLQDKTPLTAGGSDAALRALQSCFTDITTHVFTNALVFHDVAPALRYYMSGMMYRNSAGPDDARITPERWDALREAVTKEIVDTIAREGVFTSPGNVCGYLVRL